jgi:hypothetical protein
MTRKLERKLILNFSAYQHLPECRIEHLRSHPPALDYLQTALSAHMPQFSRFDKISKPMHIRRRVADKPFNPFDHDKPGKKIPIERVIEKQAMWLQNTRDFPYNLIWVFDMLKKVHCADDIEDAAFKT